MKGIYFNDSRLNSTSLEVNGETPAELRESRGFKFTMEILATLKEASSVTEIKDKIGTRHFFKDHFTFTPTPAPFRILIQKAICNILNPVKKWLFQWLLWTTQHESFQTSCAIPWSHSIIRHLPFTPAVKFKHPEYSF